MRHIMIFLVLAVFIAGCVPANIPSQSALPETASPAILSPIDEELRNQSIDNPETIVTHLDNKVGPATYSLRKGDSIVIEGRQLTVLDFNPSIIVKLQVGDIIGRIIETDYPEIIGDLEISIEKFHFVHSGSDDNFIVLRVSPVILGPDEYLIYRNRPEDIYGSSISLLEARDDYARVQVRNESFPRKVMLGINETYGGFVFILLKSYHLNEEFAIVKIVPS